MGERILVGPLPAARSPSRSSPHGIHAPGIEPDGTAHARVLDRGSRIDIGTVAGRTETCSGAPTVR